MIEIFTHGTKQFVSDVEKVNDQRICHHDEVAFSTSQSYPYECTKCGKPLTETDIESIKVSKNKE